MSHCEWHDKSAQLDAVFHVLSSAYRRRILFELKAGRLRVSEASRRLAAEYGDDRDRIELALYTIHLPKLDDLEFIEWHSDSDEIRRGAQFEEVRLVLDGLN
ncbi:hypothetical protein SAMN05421858_4055 [Haladaptatus litoreus]|uniref:DUF7344 domain-containing protein n=1 Tax=Haladaptatus litoreus TaxID=553468 RepID=A0A1N7E5Y5_9EURY|nr:hypothetical protein [Haladaptatus litoreus]SIR83552.1 hypothetical protein SAMN05421858_4055 [Haladaptatus litoreus]